MGTRIVELEVGWTTSVSSSIPCREDLLFPIRDRQPSGGLDSRHGDGRLRESDGLDRFYFGRFSQTALANF